MSPKAVRSRIRVRPMNSTRGLHTAQGLYPTRRFLVAASRSAFFLLASLFLTSVSLGQGFLRVGSIEGSVETASHAKWSLFDSSSLILFRPKGSAKVQATAASLSKPMDASSPLLHKACAQGETFPTIKIDVATTVTGGSSLIVYQLILENARINAINQFSSGSSVQESLSIEFTKLSWTTRIIAADGRVLEKGAFWDIVRNLGGETQGENFQVYGLTLSAGGIQLAWPAQKGQKFKILGSTKVEGPYTVIRETVAEETGALETLITGSDPAYFFSVQREP